MKPQIGLGSLVGLIVGLLCWRGNQSAAVVSTFPDLLTFVTLAVLLAVVRPASLQAGLTVGAAAGVVFGAAVVGLGMARFANPAPSLLIFGFLTALGSAVAGGVIAAWATARSVRWGTSTRT